MLCESGSLLDTIQACVVATDGAETRTAAARKARLVAQWRKSGESGASFARRQIPAWTFWYWQRKLSGTPAVAPAPAPAFVPVEVAR